MRHYPVQEIYAHNTIIIRRRRRRGSLHFSESFFDYIHSIVLCYQYQYSFILVVTFLAVNVAVALDLQSNKLSVTNACSNMKWGYTIYICCVDKLL